MAASWHQLPAIAFNVVSILGSNSDVLHAATVCKAWADAAAAVVLPAKLTWSTDDTAKDARTLAWMKKNSSRVRKLDIHVTGGRDQQEAAQQLLGIAAQEATTLHQLSIKVSGPGAIPDATWQLRSLHSICISNSWEPKLERLAGMTALQQLVLSDCSLQELPNSIGQLQQLTQITINQCYYLEALPDRYA
jgi:hypothetical protein